MKIVVKMAFEVEDAQGAEVRDEALLRQLARETESDVQTRLFGQGFLPDDLSVAAYDISSEVLPE